MASVFFRKGETLMKDKEFKVIYRPYITLKNGKRIYAKWYGKKAFKIEVPITE